MRILVAVFIFVLALTGSASAGNVALAPGATAVCEGTPLPCELTIAGTTYGAADTIDGNPDPADKWVAPGGTSSPGVLVNLGSLYTIGSIVITGVGSSGESIDFEVFVGTNSSLSTTDTAVGTLVSGGTPVQEFGGAMWTAIFAVSPSTPIQYILYDVTTSSMSLGGGGSLDDAYANDIEAFTPTPEPGTFGLIGGAGLLVLGLVRRRFQS